MCGPDEAVSGGVITTQSCRSTRHWELSWWGQGCLGDDPSLFPTTVSQLVCPQYILSRALLLSRMKSPTYPVGTLLESPVFSLMSGTWGALLSRAAWNRGTAGSCSQDTSGPHEGLGWAGLGWMPALWSRAPLDSSASLLTPLSPVLTCPQGRSTAMAGIYQKLPPVAAAQCCLAL